MIASSAFFVLDGILDWPVVNYDGSWSQWGQLAGYTATNGGQLRSDSPWRTDTAARSELIVYNYENTAGPVFFTGTGLNDMTAGGTFTGTVNRTFRIEIDNATVTPNTFRWSQDGGTPWTASGIAITAAVAQTLVEGMTVTFASDAGHTLTDRWDFITKRPVEILSLDGGSCSGRLNLTGPTNTYEPVGCLLVPPSSYALSANQIEEEDADYMQGGAGGGGGAPITPGY